MLHAGFGIQVSWIKVFQIADTYDLLDLFTRFTIIVALISIALRIRYDFIKKQERNLVIIVLR